MSYRVQVYGIVKIEEFIKFEEFLFNKLKTDDKINMKLSSDFISLLDWVSISNPGYVTIEFEYSYSLPTNFEQWYEGKEELKIDRWYNTGSIVEQWLRYEFEHKNGFVLEIGEAYDDTSEGVFYDDDLVTYDGTVIKPIYVKRVIVDENKEEL